MINRIEIITITNKNQANVYTIDKKFTKKELIIIGDSLTNPVSQKSFINKTYYPKKFYYAIEIGYLPGVTDNIATTTKEIIEDKLNIKFNKNENVFTSQIIFIDQKLSRQEIIKTTEEMYNPIIQKAIVKNFKDYIKKGKMGLGIPKVVLKKNQNVTTVNLDISDNDLIKLGKLGIINQDGSRRGPLSLDLTELKEISTYFKKNNRQPTDIELESIAQTWSEHCKHNVFASPIDEIKEGLFTTYIKGATNKINNKKFCYSLFSDNSGAIEFDKNYLITHKVETHNSPSALDPFGGAITGIVGVNRDAIGFGLGAKPVINQYGFCLAYPESTQPLFRGKNKSQKMLKPKQIMEGVIRGVNVGGNCSGIPTPQGFIYFDDRYKGKPLVFVGTVGLIPKLVNNKKSYVKKARIGDYIVMVGGRVGKDGIHGATFSSEAMNLSSPVSAVQIGDPICQKKLSDALIKEARDLNLYTSITDNGAGGLSCSVAEMAQETNGCLVNLDKVPLKYNGLKPWQIWISESQERMTLAVSKNKWLQLKKILAKRGVEASVIGEFTNSKKCVVNYKNKQIMSVDLDFLHNGLPKRLLKSVNVLKNYPEPKFKQPKDLTKTLHLMLQRHNLSGYEFLSKQYDHEVQGGSVLKPLQGKGRVNADTTITRPILNSHKGVVISQGLYPSYGDIDTYQMSACCIDTAIRNTVVTGASLNRLALLDNFCWCSSDKPEKLGELKKSVKACYDYAVSFHTPFISGKDSMFNDFKGYDENGKKITISIPPTLLITAIGIINDINKAISIDFKNEGDLIYILGETKEELGGSEYFNIKGKIGNSVPKVNAIINKKLYSAIELCIKKELLTAAISVNRGGIGIALAKMAIAGDLGIKINLKKVPKKCSRNDYVLFSETQGRAIVTVDPINKSKFEKIMTNNVFGQIGKVTKKKVFIIKDSQKRIIIKSEIKKLSCYYKKTFKLF